VEEGVGVVRIGYGSTEQVRAAYEAAGAGLPTLDKNYSPLGVPLYGFRAERGTVRSWWEKLRPLYETTGLWPFVSHVGPYQWEWIQKRSDTLASGPPSHSLEKSNALVQEITECRAERLSDLHLKSRIQDFSEAPDVGQGSDSARNRGYISISESAVFANVPQWVCLVPVNHCADIPIYLNCPDVANWSGGSIHPSLTYADHSAFLYSWNSKYGAELFYVGDGALELVVSRPPSDRRDVVCVANEQYAYCDDLAQVFGDVVDVVRKQVPAPTWFFWWD
jgi:hypothetical protein